MGGLGSGRHSSHGGKPQTKDSLPLDIRKIVRKGLLLPKNRFTWQWRVNDRQVAIIAIEVDLDLCMALSYRVRGAEEVVEQQVQTQSSPCHLGGLRHWFTCPRCDKRVALLYAHSGSFVCRKAVAWLTPRRNWALGTGPA